MLLLCPVQDPLASSFAFRALTMECTLHFRPCDKRRKTYFLRGLTYFSKTKRWINKSEHSFCKYLASWPLSSKKKTIAMTVYVNSIEAF